MISQHFCTLVLELVKNFKLNYVFNMDFRINKKRGGSNKTKGDNLFNPNYVYM